MAFLTNRNSILETLREHPEKVRKLWIEAGYGRACEEYIKEAKLKGVQFKILPKEAFARRFKEGRSHICLEREEVSYADPDELVMGIDTAKNPLYCALDGVYDPQNLGNIVRSAACLGVEAVVIPKDRSCGITETVTNISRGALEHVKIVRVVNLARFIDEVKAKGVFCYALDERGTAPLWEIDLKGPVCLVFGGEDGLRRLTVERCDAVVKIPTLTGFPSLNVAVSFAVSAYEVRRQRRG
jgi:23S rRNA (guanosine2251-2'-O)-methyltransferase